MQPNTPHGEHSPTFGADALEVLGRINLIGTLCILKG
jgi:hypothetical protein